jgi:endonuclease I
MNKPFLPTRLPLWGLLCAALLMAACTPAVDDDGGGTTADMGAEPQDSQESPDLTEDEAPEDTGDDTGDNGGDAALDWDLGQPDAADLPVQEDAQVDAGTPEDSAEACSDEVDNDGDGAVDCDDPDCAPRSGMTTCGPVEGDEDSDAACSDNFDNDEDGYTDCEDYDCSRNPAVTVCGQGGVEDTDALCSDGVDNDGDGYADCQDYDCSRNTSVTVCTVVDEDSDAACSDGIDNDRDGDVDCDDVDCIGNPAVTTCRGDTTGDEDTEERCRDGVDNDDDGAADCAEPSCQDILVRAECGDDPFWPVRALRGDDLRDQLNDLVSGHNVYTYAVARDVMYGLRDSIDIFDGMIECVYTGYQVRPDGTRTPGDLFQTEHSWPRSEGTGEEPAVSDIHHLFPALTEANQARSNHDYGVTDCSGDGCSYERGGSQLGRNASNFLVMEVRPERRGDVARAHFYVAVRYELSIPDFEEEVLRAWHLQDPPDRRERIRNRRIEVHQRNLNPFIVHPEFVDAISDF